MCSCLASLPASYHAHATLRCCTIPNALPFPWLHRVSVAASKQSRAKQSNQRPQSPQSPQSQPTSQPASPVLACLLSLCLSAHTSTPTAAREHNTCSTCHPCSPHVFYRPLARVALVIGNATINNATSLRSSPTAPGTALLLLTTNSLTRHAAPSARTSVLPLRSMKFISNINIFFLHRTSQKNIRSLRLSCKWSPFPRPCPSGACCKVTAA